MDGRNSNRNSSNHRAHNSVPQARLHHAIAAVCELLEERRLLSLTPDQQFIHAWNNMGPRLRHDLALLEYAYPAAAAQLDSYLQTLGLTPVAPIAGPLPTISDSLRKISRRASLKGILAHLPRKPKPKAVKGFHPDLPAPLTVTGATYYYNATLPNQIAFTFNEEATASNWNSAVTVIDLNSGATIPVSGTYSSALDTIVYNLNSSSILGDGNYAAILHGSQITDTSYSVDLEGSDGNPGDDYAYTFSFYDGDFNGDRAVNSIDLQQVLDHFNETGSWSYAQGDANYDGSVNSIDLEVILDKFDTTLPLLGTPATLTTADAGDTRMTIAWDAPSDPNVTEFDVYRDSTRIATDITATVFLDTSLTPGTTYDYFIVGKDASNDSSWPSDELVTSTPAITSLTVQPPATGVINAGGTYALSTTFADIGALTTHTAVINWGDGTTGTATIVESGNTGTLSGSHEYDGFGAFFGTVAVTDPNGSNAVEIFEVIVPTFYDYDSGDGFTVGKAYTLTPTFSDPDGDTPASYTVAWGDGSATETYSSSATDFTHTFSSATDSPYAATVLAMAADGTFTDYPYIAEVAPTLSVSGGSGATEGAAVVITGAVSGSSSGDTYEWTIDWGDGSDPVDVTTAPGAFSYTYAEAGTYTVDVYVSDDTSGEADDQELTVNVAIAMATASFSAVGSATEGVAASFSDTFTDPDGDTLQNLSIAWGDGDSDGYYLDPGTVNHDYDAPGTYTGTAIFSYDDGTYAAEFTRAVADAAVTVGASGATITRGEPYTLDTTFTDPAGDTPTQWIVAWGDSETSTYGTSPDYQGTFVHQYDPDTAPATPTVQVTFTDPYGTYSASTTISMLEPVFNFVGTGVGAPGVPYYAHDFEYPTDAGGSFTYSISWGDGSASYETTAPTFSHIFNSYGAYMATITVSNDTYSTTAFSDIAVGSTCDGTISLSGGTSGTLGDTFTVACIISNGPTIPFLWSIDWGDNSIDTYSNSSSQTFTHAYATQGTYDIYADGALESYLFPEVAAIHELMTVGPSTVTPTLTAGSGTTATVVGEPYTLSYSWQNLSGDLVDIVNTYSVAWGDGTSTDYVSAATAFTHSYKTASTSGTTESITVTGALNNGHTYIASTSLVVSQPDMHLVEANGSYMNVGAQNKVGGYLSVDPYPTPTTAADPALLTIAFDEEPTPVGGTYVLTWSSTHFRVWADADKTTSRTSGYSFQDWGGPLPPVFIQGTTASAKTDADQITLTWMKTGQPSLVVDRAGLNVLGFSGPSDVPAYGTYSYQLTAGPVIESDMMTAIWNATGGSSIASDPDNNRWASIAWNMSTEGAGQGWLGEPILEYDGFDVVAKLVNVVNVVVSAPTGGAFASGTPQVGSVVHINGHDRQAINSNTPPTPAMSWHANITLNGPTNNGVANAGIDEIEVGFIQNLADYTNNGSYADHMTLHSSMNNVTAVLDTVNGQPIPWYYFDGGSIFLPDNTDDNVKEISQDDSPNNGPRYTDDNGSRLMSITLIEDFNLYVAAETLDTDNKANKAYVGEATARWSFNGNATYDKAIDQLLLTTYAKDTPPTAGWQTAQGSMPTTIGPIANSLGLTEDFS